ncbi:MAG: foldase protein PrsA [Oligoflexus sp.]
MKRRLRQVTLSTASALFMLSTSPLLANQVASFKGGKLTVEEYKNAVEALGPQADMVKFNENLRSQYLNHLIDSMLLAKKATSSKLDQSPEYKMMVEAAQRDILARMYIDQYVEQQATPENLKKYFEKNKEAFSSKEVRASHILFEKDQKEKAEKVLKEAKKKNADFTALAKEHSTGPSAEQGGDLNFFGKGRMVPAFEQAAFETAKGQVHPELVETQFGWHIIKVTDVRGGDTVKFEDKKDEVDQVVRKNAREELVEDLRKQADVQVNNEVLKNIKF